ncbi:hypothetical protein ES707_03984 [subsurface metagenome]
MSRLPQLLPGQQAIPWYQSGFFWAGIAIVIIALLILIVPPKLWKNYWHSVLEFPTWLRETYIWYRYGPKSILEVSDIDFELYADEQSRRYSAKVFLTVFVSEKTRSYYPVRCSFRNVSFQLKQKHAMIPLSASLELNPLLETEFLLNTPGKTIHWVGLSWFPYNNPVILFIDLQKPYTWIIKDVHMRLDNLQKYRKLSRKGRVSNLKETALMGKGM